MIPDRLNIDRVALIETFLVTGGQTVRPGFPVKLASTQTDPNILQIQEAALPTDIPIGLAQGLMGDVAFAAGVEMQVLCFFHVVERAMAGGSGVTLGQRVCVDSGGTGLIPAPASNPGGATLTFTPGICLATVNVNEAFPLGIMPMTYVTT